MKKYYIVIGLGFGDEGKAVAVSYLCKKISDQKIVVRFNGGHQAGHTAVFNGVRHVFSMWGSGTLQGVPTYWSKYCTFYPLAFLNERAILEKKMKLYHFRKKQVGDFHLPDYFADPLCPVTTPYDVAANKIQAKKTGHGSVGVGFGTTVLRHEMGLKLHLQDICHETVLRAKLENIRKYYNFNDSEVSDEDLENFIKDCAEITKYVILHHQRFVETFPNVIFEGAQGILLDQDFGFFPNVTRSYTTSRNAVEIIKDIARESYLISKLYVTRTYQTRHGNGFLSREEEKVVLKNNENETNQLHEYQGKFRIAPLDPEMINYALKSDIHFTQGIPHENSLLITCNDQLEFPLKIDSFIDYSIGESSISGMKIEKIESIFREILLSESPEGPQIVSGTQRRS